MTTPSTPSPERPTTQDLARDALADLVACNKATPGPWEWTSTLKCGPGCYEDPDSPAFEPPGYANILLAAPGRTILAVKDSDVGLPSLIANLDLIEDCRMLLPAYIRRALHAEHLLRLLFNGPLGSGAWKATGDFLAALDSARQR